MDRTLYIILGRYGDIMAALPLVQHEVDCGRKPCIMVSAEYADLLEGTSLDRIVWDGDWRHVGAAYGSVRKDWPRIVVLQQYSTDGWPTHHATDSFVKEMYRCAGKLPLFGKLALTFDRRDTEREAHVVRGWPDYSVVLLATSGFSSPFPWRDQLYGLLQRELGKRTVLCLDGMREHRVYDVLAFFERSACLVTIDSAMLHLAQAAPRLPVIALVADNPTLWHGSPAYAGQRLRVRYGEYPARAAEVVSCALALLQSAPALGERPAPASTRATELAP